MTQHTPDLGALADKRILIVEDEVFIALDIATELECLGAKVVGPSATAEEGLNLLKHEAIDGAIADVNLLDGDALPLLRMLQRQDVPVVIHTGGALPWIYHDQFPHLPVCTKPSTPMSLAEALRAEMLARAKPINADEAGRDDRDRAAGTNASIGAHPALS